MRSTAALLVSAFFAAGGPVRPAWSQTADFLVSAYTTGPQDGAAAALLPSGVFVVAWAGQGADDASGVFANGFDADGAPLGPGLRVNSYTTSFQFWPSVAAEAGGGFVVVWAGCGSQDGADCGVFGQRYDALGSPVAGEFQVNTYTTGRQYQAHVGADPAGGFVVVWSSFGADGNHWSVAGRRYDAAGTPLGLEFQVNTYTTYAQLLPKVAVDGSSRFVIVWNGYNHQDGDTAGIFGQRYQASGLRDGGEFRVNSYTTGAQAAVSVAAEASGSFVVLWTSYGQDGSGAGLFGQRYDAAGVTQGGEFQVNAYTTSYQRSPAVAWTGQGDFLVSWSDDTLDGSSWTIVARRFRMDGNPLGPEFRVNAYTTAQQLAPALAVRPDGGFLTAWVDARDGGSSIYGRIIPDLIFADGLESGGVGAWSSASTDGGDLSVTPAAALVGTQGLQALLDDTAGLFVQDDSPEDEGRYRARFWVHPNGFDPGESAGKRRTRVLIAFQDAPSRRLMAVVLRRISGQYALMGRARRDDNSQANTGFFAISDAPHAVEVAWSRSGTPDANDGTFEMWIDGALVSSLTGLDNHASGIDFVRLGALSVKTSAAGTLFFDAFDSRRASYAGP